MSIKSFIHTFIYLDLISVLFLAACGKAPTPEPIVETLVVTERVQGTPVEVIRMVTPTPEPISPRTLVVCLGQEPRTLFPFESGMLAASHIFEAIYDGPYDSNSFAFQPVILEKLPSLSDGDAVLETVTVNEGDVVVDAEGEVVLLDSSADPPIMLLQAEGETPTPYRGGSVEMEQLSSTFKLLPGIQWSDGTPLTAYDSVYGYQVASDPEIGWLNYIQPRTAEYKALDELTSIWTGLPGFMDPLYYHNFFQPAPRHAWQQFTSRELSEADVSSRTPMGWGPYIITEWVQGDSVRLQKNPHYWRFDEGLPHFETLIYRFTGGDGNKNLAALLTGECDIVDQTAGLAEQGELMLALDDSNQIKATFVTGTVWELISFGIQHVDYDDGYDPEIDRPDFFSDPRMRQALLMCMDRQAAVDSVFFGQSEVIDTYVPSIHPLYNSAVHHYEYDPSVGSTLLGEIGWIDDDNDPLTARIAQGVENIPDGTQLVIKYETVSSAIREQVTAIVQDSLQGCGVGVTVQLYPAAEWFEGGPEGRLFGRHFDLGELTLATGVIPPCDLYLSSQVAGPMEARWISIQDGLERVHPGWNGSNWVGFVNEAYDSACNAAQNSLSGQPEFQTGHLEAQRIFAEQLPSAPLFLMLKTAATRPDLCNFIMDPTANSEFWNIEEFDYGLGCNE